MIHITHLVYTYTMTESDNFYREWAVITAADYPKYLIMDQGWSPLKVLRNYDEIVKDALRTASIFTDLDPELRETILRHLQREKKKVLWYWIKKHLSRIWSFLWSSILGKLAFYLRY